MLMAKRHKTSLLLLTQSLNDIKLNIQSIIDQSFKYIKNNNSSNNISSRLYIYLNPLQTTDDCCKNASFIQNRYLYRNLIKKIYQLSFNSNSNIDVNCLMYNINKSNGNSMANILSKPLDYSCVLTDFKSDQIEVLKFVENFIPSAHKIEQLYKIHLGKIESDPNDDAPRLSENKENDLIFKENFYENVIVAGTFDRLHVGHKILLSEAALLVTNKLLIGITTDVMNKKKLLADLIEPLDTRIEKIKDFLSLISPNIYLEFAPLVDAYGPSITEKDYHCLIVSDETRKGGDAVNRKRLENNLSPLDIHVIELIDDKIGKENNEDKISSSKERMRLLGSLLREPYKRYNPCEPYLVGLTGCISSGKSSVRKRLEGLGAGSIDCDLLGHQTYIKDSNAYKKIIQEFGSVNVLDSNGNINRKALGEIVFSSDVKLKQLTNIVWPEIARLVDEQVEKLYKEGKRVIVVEAALLIDAQWHLKMNEIWVCYMNEEESIRRTMERDKITEENARKRLKSQLTNAERIKYANVILATLWDPDFTQIQCEKAWNSLMRRLENV